MISIFIPMAPMGKARPRVTRFGTYMPRKYSKWKKDFGTMAKLAWSPFPAICVPYAMRVVVGTITGKTRSDLDNIFAAAADALQDAGLIANDRDCRQLSAKIITSKIPGISVEVEAL